MKCPRCNSRVLNNFGELECIACGWDSFHGIARVATEEDQPKFNRHVRMPGEAFNPFLERQGVFETLMEGAA